MTQETILKIFESYLNGNISWAKRQIKKITKADFIDFIEMARGHGIMPYKLRVLVQGKNAGG